MAKRSVQISTREVLLFVALVGVSYWSVIRVRKAERDANSRVLLEAQNAAESQRAFRTEFFQLKTELLDAKVEIAELRRRLASPPTDPN